MHKIEWAFHNPVRIEAAPGVVSRLGHFLPAQGNFLLVSTPGFVKRGNVQRIVDMVGAERIRLFTEVTPNPELDDLEKVNARFVTHSITAIIALGGGSVMDAAKVLSVTLPCGFTQPLEVTLRGGAKHTWQTNLPVIAIPTTAGTGAEVTPFATVWDGTTHKKYSVMGSRVYPHTTLLDPELTLSLPASETLYTALDAISHSLESLWNRNRTPISEAYSVQALQMAIIALPRVIAEPANLEARALMQQASVLAGLAISQTRTAIAHSISYPLTSYYNVPHGLACSFTLENLITVYLAQQPQHTLRRLLENAQAMLRRLNLPAHMAKYVNQSQINSLTDEMFTPGRADNFEGSLSNLEQIITFRG